jgi:tRNA pseudouridine32 synthase/23S rRNA pseudouridine746 synthase
VTYFTSFSTAIKGIDLPKKFTFPFYYEPHRLAEIASAELQAYLRTENELNHSFGIDTDNHEIGKMFGVLVVQNLDNELGYLSAFSGNIEGQSNFKKFVPPIYDILAKESFFQKDNKELVALSEEINLLEKEDNYLQLKESVFKNNQLANKIILDVKRELAKRKQLRNQFKKNSILLSKEEHDVLKKESAHDKFYFKELVCYYESKFINQQEELNTIEVKLRNLKALRVKKSNALHQKIFNQYHFLNIDKKEKDLNSIFAALNIPAPAGTGDCAAPKLLQYAFLNDLKPIAMAEFWWGKSGNSAIRKHKNFYPSCKGKCEPILSHMLDGMELDENPLLLSLAKDKKIEILFEDDSMLVINKPTELLSVPGKNVSDSVFNRLKEKYPKSTDYLIVHRLDMSTSGIMLIAKTKKVHKFLQAQFINRTIKKKYIALLDGLISKNKGEIDLPLRVDLDDRPKQLVCFEHGRPSNTLWKVLERKDNKTLIEFTPTTGRTHQLRVHAAHILGLNTAIVGDDLYGKKANRLHLHAAFIKFVHPKTKKVMEFLLPPKF